MHSGQKGETKSNNASKT